MLARLCSATIRDFEAEPVDVEVDLSRGLPSWSLVGLPDGAVREARDRVRAALLNSNSEFPLRHITVNLSPADKRKDGSHFDLPMAVGLLMASGQMIVPQANIEEASVVDGLDIIAVSNLLEVIGHHLLMCRLGIFPKHYNTEEIMR